MYYEMFAVQCNGIVVIVISEHGARQVEVLGMRKQRSVGVSLREKWWSCGSEA
jgi:hypothetical protein